MRQLIYQDEAYAALVELVGSAGIRFRVFAGE
jgi:hypothetical protein